MQVGMGRSRAEPEIPAAALGIEFPSHSMCRTRARSSAESLFMPSVIMPHNA
jgi:hypothetical protein